MDIRRRNRGLLREHQTAWRESYTRKIFRSCRGLVELGMPVLWQAFAMPTSRYRQSVSDIQSLRSSTPFILTMNIDSQYQILVAKTTYSQRSQPTRNEYTCYFHDDGCGDKRTRAILHREPQGCSSQLKRPGIGIVDSRSCAHRSPECWSTEI